MQALWVQPIATAKHLVTHVLEVSEANSTRREIRAGAYTELAKKAAKTLEGLHVRAACLSLVRSSAN